VSRVQGHFTNLYSTKKQVLALGHDIYLHNPGMLRTRLVYILAEVSSF